jgi:hypothetical protein
VDECKPLAQGGEGEIVRRRRELWGIEAAFHASASRECRERQGSEEEGAGCYKGGSQRPKRDRQDRAGAGKAVQVDSIKPTVKAPGTKCLKLRYYLLLSNVDFNLNLRRYTLAVIEKDISAIDSRLIKAGSDVKKALDIQAGAYTRQYIHESRLTNTSCTR